MRASSVKNTAKRIGSSSKLARRSLLLSLVLASSSVAPQTACAQQPSSTLGQSNHAAGLIRNSDFAQSYGNRVVSKVRENTARGGEIRSNPFFASGQPSQASQASSNSQQRSRTRAHAQVHVNPLPAETHSVGNAFAQRQSTRRSSGRLQTVAAPFLQPLDHHASPGQTAGQTAGQIRPVNETRDVDAVAEQAEPIVFSFTDDANDVTSIAPESSPSGAEDATDAAQENVTETNLAPVPVFETLEPIATPANESNTDTSEEAESVDENVGELPDGFLIQEAPLIDFAKSMPDNQSQPADADTLVDSGEGVSLSLSDSDDQGQKPDSPASIPGGIESNVESLKADALADFESAASEIEELAEMDSPVSLAPVVDFARQVPLPEELDSGDDSIRVNPNVPASEIKPPSAVGPIQVNRAKNAVPLVSQQDGRAPVTVAMPPIEIEETLEASDQQNAPVLSAVTEPKLLPKVGQVTEPSKTVELAVPPTLDAPNETTIGDAIEELPELPPPAKSAPMVAAAPAVELARPNSVKPIAPRSDAMAENAAAEKTATENTAVHSDPAAPMPVFADRAPSITELTESDQTPLIGSPVEVDPARNYDASNDKAQTSKTISAKQPSAEHSFATEAESGNVNLASMHRRGGNRGMGFPQPAPALQSPESSTVDESIPELPKPSSEPRLESQSTSRPAAGQSLETAGNQIVLRLRRGQVRSMTIGGTLRGVNIADKETCQAFAAGANEFKLIGTGLGTTELTVWADVRSGKPTQKQTFRIVVSESLDATGDQVTERTDLLNDSIQQAFPTASVLVTQRQGQLFVEGECPSESMAKQVIRLVRKSCLIPVQDKLVVR